MLLNLFLYILNNLYLKILIYFYLIIYKILLNYLYNYYSSIITFKFGIIIYFPKSFHLLFN